MIDNRGMTCSDAVLMAEVQLAHPANIHTTSPCVHEARVAKCREQARRQNQKVGAEAVWRSTLQKTHLIVLECNKQHCSEIYDETFDFILGCPCLGAEAQVDSLAFNPIVSTAQCRRPHQNFWPRTSHGCRLACRTQPCAEHRNRPTPPSPAAVSP